MRDRQERQVRHSNSVHAAILLKTLTGNQLFLHLGQAAMELLSTGTGHIHSISTLRKQLQSFQSPMNEEFICVTSLER